MSNDSCLQGRISPAYSALPPPFTQPLWLPLLLPRLLRLPLPSLAQPLPLRLLQLWLPPSRTVCARSLGNVNSTHCTGGSCRPSRHASSSPRTCTRRNRRASHPPRWATSAPCTTDCPARTRPCICRCRATSARCPASSSGATSGAPLCNTRASRCSRGARRPAGAGSTALAELRKHAKTVGYSSSKRRLARGTREGGGRWARAFEGPATDYWNIFYFRRATDHPAKQDRSIMFAVRSEGEAAVTTWDETREGEGRCERNRKKIAEMMDRRILRIEIKSVIKIRPKSKGLFREGNVEEPWERSNTQGKGNRLTDRSDMWCPLETFIGDIMKTRGRIGRRNSILWFEFTSQNPLFLASIAFQRCTTAQRLLLTQLAGQKYFFYCSFFNWRFHRRNLAAQIVESS